MTETTTAVLGIAATIAVAAIAALFKLIKITLDMQKQQTDYRHKLRDDMTSIVLNSEHRLETRIERLERQIIGVRKWPNTSGDQSSGN